MTSECFSSGRASLIVCGENLIEHELQIVRQRRLELHLTSVGWMSKHEAACMEKRPVEREDGTQIAGHAPAESSVHRVADDRVADLAQMHANLMCPPGCDRHVYERDARHVQRSGNSSDCRSRAPGFC